MPRRSSKKNQGVEEEITTTTTAEEKGEVKTETIFEEGVFISPILEADVEPSTNVVPEPIEEEVLSEADIKQLEADLDQVETMLKKDIPTKLEIQRGNASFVKRLMAWEKDNFHLVERWRDIQKRLGIRKKLDELRPDGIEYTPNQQLKRRKA